MINYDDDDDILMAFLETDDVAVGIVFRNDEENPIICI